MSFPSNTHFSPRYHFAQTILDPHPQLPNPPTTKLNQQPNMMPVRIFLRFGNGSLTAIVREEAGEPLQQPPTTTTTDNNIVAAQAGEGRIFLSVKRKRDDLPPCVPLKKRRSIKVTGRPLALQAGEHASRHLVGVFNDEPITEQFQHGQLFIANPWGWAPHREHFRRQCKNLSKVNDLLSACMVECIRGAHTLEKQGKGFFPNMVLYDRLEKLQTYLAKHQTRFAKEIDCEEMLSKLDWQWIKEDWQHMRTGIFGLHKFRELASPEPRVLIGELIAYTIGQPRSETGLGLEIRDGMWCSPREAVSNPILTLA